MPVNNSVTVVGAGVIGLSIAWRAAVAGFRVSVIDPAAARGASHVAGGMLAPLSEGWPGEDHLLDLGTRALELWPEFAGELGADLITAHGSLTCAFDTADIADIETIAEYVTARGHEVELLSRQRIRELEPALAQNVRRALHAPGELAVDNRAVLRALMAACAALGVRTVARRVDPAELEPGALDDLAAGGHMVLSAGWATAALRPSVPVRPVKGEILRVRSRPGSTPRPTRTVRASVHGRAVYLVPRADGMVIGATQYEHGDDTAVTVAGVRDLLADAERLFPGIGDYELLECAAGLRPGSPDNAPIVERVSESVLVATGHARNGMLLAPLTAETVVREMTRPGPAGPLTTSDNERCTT